MGVEEEEYTLARLPDHMTLPGRPGGQTSVPFPLTDSDPDLGYEGRMFLRGGSNGGGVNSAPVSHDPILGLQQLRVRYTDEHVRLRSPPGHTLGGSSFASAGGLATNAQLDVLFGLSPSSRPFSSAFRSERSLTGRDADGALGYFPNPGRESAARAVRQQHIDQVNTLPDGRIDHPGARWPLLPPSTGPVRRAMVAGPEPPPRHTLAARGTPPQPWEKQPAYDEAMPWSARQARPVTCPSHGLKDSKRWEQAIDHLRHNHDINTKVGHVPTPPPAKLAARMPEIVHSSRNWRSFYALEERHKAISLISTSWPPLKRREATPNWYTSGFR
jgi:hypothetical protein